MKIMPGLQSIMQTARRGQPRNVCQRCFVLNARHYISADTFQNFHRTHATVHKSCSKALLYGQSNSNSNSHNKHNIQKSHELKLHITTFTCSDKFCHPRHFSWGGTSKKHLLYKKQCSQKLLQNNQVWGLAAMLKEITQKKLLRGGDAQLSTSPLS